MIGLTRPVILSTNIGNELMSISMQNWQSKSELELMRAIYCETYKMVRNSEPPPLPIERWESLNWLSVATEKLLDEHLEVAEDLSKVISNIGD
jgi:CRISPR/Cas system-associated endonuclease Cas3-HD